MTKLAASPFGVVSSGGYSFVTVGGYTGLNELQVYRDGGLHPELVRRVALPVPGAASEALTPDGGTLLVAAGRGVTVVDARRARTVGAHAVLGSLQAPMTAGQSGTLVWNSAIEVAVTPDGDYAFVALEYAGRVAVFDLRAARAAGWRRSGYLGMIPVGLVNVGLAVSPDGRTLYATRDVSSAAGPSRPGSLVVIDVAKAEKTPTSSVISRVAAGCDPVRVAATADGKMVWVTARASNAVLGFSASRLAKNPQKALERVVQVGEAPVGLTLLDGGRRIVVMNSNRFGVIGAAPSLSIVDASRGKLIGSVRAGAFPREAAATASVLLVSNWGSQELEAVGIAGLIGARSS
jgi:hypothetical protein